MKIAHWYKDYFESRISGRYVFLDTIYPLLNDYKLNFELTVVGHSELGEDIPMLKIGNGKKIVLGWSQMHGNESTTTKAIFDFIKFINQKDYFQSEINQFLKDYSFYVLPMLNPDGARNYTRHNANNIDLNRDAQTLSQRESQILRRVVDAVKPSLCLNLHDQRSIYGFKNGKPATVSFLSPAANKNRTLTEARIVAMRHIVAINKTLQTYIPGQVGRYDDSFNPACVGDTFQMEGIPTILFEAGHTKQDYQREKTREYIFYALLSVFDIVGPKASTVTHAAYFDIPENLKNYKDLILRNVKLDQYNKPVSVAIQYREVLKDDRINFEPYIDEIGSLKNYFGYIEKNVNGAEILTNLQGNLTVGENITKIRDKSNESIIFFHKNNSFLN
ncbi:peptidase M14 [Aequorivita sp. F47161]|uniref:Peptidase M14 n=1 Tax=Aequorivita vitellina TaxID=2874475 RepID=A0A9X1QW26_9FLAO|nr:M14 family zinc carboxypeptidase [Aequorivita vitellina]MCG2418869.1 peptidase M14 [Aequorivita vitellina]